MSVVTGKPVRDFTANRISRPALEAGAAKGIDAGAVRLVKGSLEDKIHRQVPHGLLQPAGDFECQVRVFQYAGAGNQQ